MKDGREGVTSLRLDCKHLDEYVERGNGIYTDWCLIHDCLDCETCTKYKKDK